MDLIKKTIIVAILSAMFLGIATINAQSDYQVVAERMTWYNAKSYAESLGGHLVTINDENENRHVVNLARSKGITDDVFWIGFTDQEHEGDFRWITDEPVTYTNWYPGEPNNYQDQDYGTIGWGDPYLWDDTWGTLTKPFVVEFEQGGDILPPKESETFALGHNFRSAISVEMGVPVDFNTLYQRVNTIYDVVEHDDQHIIWKFTGTTGDHAFVFTDGRIAVASSVDFDLGTKDVLCEELNKVIDMLSSVGGEVSDTTRNEAINSAAYYAQNEGIYHCIKYDYTDGFGFLLTVPNCTVENARLTVTGKDYHRQEYYIDGNYVTGCCKEGGGGYCSVESPVDITDKIPTGVHSISTKYVSTDYSKPEKHTMYIEAITTPTSRKFVLYDDDYDPWMEEATKSLNLYALQEFLYR